LLERRLDGVDVIGQTLALSIAVGLRMPPVAKQFGVRMTTAEHGSHTTPFDSRRQLLYVFLPGSCRAAVYDVGADG